MLKACVPLVAVGILVWPGLAVAQDQTLRNVKRSLERAESNLCRSLDLKNCKPTKAASGKAKAAATKSKSKTREQAAKKENEPDASAVFRPVPRERPRSVALVAATSQKNDASEKSESKTVETVTTPAKPQPAAVSASVVDSPPRPVLRPVKKQQEEVKGAAKQFQDPAADKATQVSNRALAAEKSAILITTRPGPKNPDAAERDCTKVLASLGAEYKLAAVTVSNSNCSVDNPVKLISVKAAKGEINFPEQPVMACSFAVTFAGWARNVASPLMKATRQQGVASIATGPGFDCRGRNGDPTAKMSEHASGNAVDIASFKLTDGTVLRVNAKEDQPALKALRASACEVFTTVLGPGANAAHEEHFHFDLAERKNGYRICQ